MSSKISTGVQTPNKTLLDWLLHRGKCQTSMCLYFLNPVQVKLTLRIPSQRSTSASEQESCNLRSKGSYIESKKSSVSNATVLMHILPPDPPEPFYRSQASLTFYAAVICHVPSNKRKTDHSGLLTTWISTCHTSLCFSLLLISSPASSTLLLSPSLKGSQILSLLPLSSTSKLSLTRATECNQLPVVTTPNSSEDVVLKTGTRKQCTTKRAPSSLAPD